MAPQGPDDSDHGKPRSAEGGQEQVDRRGEEQGGGDVVGDRVGDVDDDLYNDLFNVVHNNIQGGVVKHSLSRSKFSHF